MDIIFGLIYFECTMFRVLSIPLSAVVVLLSKHGFKIGPGVYTDLKLAVFEILAAVVPSTYLQ